MDVLERESGYKEELFDFIQQFLRTILLKRTNSENLAYDRRCILTLSIPRSSSISSLIIVTPFSIICATTFDSANPIRRPP
jgi:Dynein light intermediate chain (DLIC)